MFFAPNPTPSEPGSRGATGGTARRNHPRLPAPSGPWSACLLGPEVTRETEGTGIEGPEERSQVCAGHTQGVPPARPHQCDSRNTCTLHDAPHVYSVGGRNPRPCPRPTFLVTPGKSRRGDTRDAPGRATGLGTPGHPPPAGSVTREHDPKKVSRLHPGLCVQPLSTLTFGSGSDPQDLRTHSILQPFLTCPGSQDLCHPFPIS